MVPTFAASDTVRPPVRLRDGLAFAFAVYVGVRVMVSLTGVLAVGHVAPPSFDPDGAQRVGIHNAVDGTNRWDAVRYEAIAATGYDADDASAAFFPGYPLTIRVIGLLTPLGPFGSAILVSNLSYLVALVVLYGLTAREYDVPTARRATVLLALFPASFFFLVPYSESLFLLLTVLTFWWFRAERRALGATAAVGASVVRSAGVLLVPALLIEALTVHGPRRRRAFAAALIPLLGPVAYGIYWLGRTGDALQPLRAQSSWSRTFQWAPGHGVGCDPPRCAGDRRRPRDLLDGRSLAHRHRPRVAGGGVAHSAPDLPGVLARDDPGDPLLPPAGTPPAVRTALPDRGVPRVLGIGDARCGADGWCRSPRSSASDSSCCRLGS